MANNWYQKNATQVLEELNTTLAQGLSDAEFQTRLEKFGTNELVERGGRTRWQILVEQLTGILTLVLFGAALVSIFLHEYIDAIVILIIVVLNALLGYSQEYRAEKSMAALKRMATPLVRVRRTGRVQEISARDLVPGDVVLLETGNVVPADGRVIESINLRAVEAALTGEAEAVDKFVDQVYDTEKPLGDRRNMLFMGTMITYGHGAMVATNTGMETELGHIASLIQSVEDEDTPLQQRLDRLGKVLAVVALVIVVVIFVLGVLQGNEIEEMLLTSVSLAVAAIPEALTAVVTIALSLGAQRMLKRQALIRKLPAVETLGSVSVICSDKTGTLTQNRMTVTAIDIANHRLTLEKCVDDPCRQFVPADGSEVTPGVLPTLDLLLLGGALCNDAILVDEDAPDGTTYHVVGDPTEAALVLAANSFEISKNELELAFPRVGEVPFDSVRKRMTTLHKTPQSRDDIPASIQPVWDRRARPEMPTYLTVTKGAVDGMLSITSQVWVEGEFHPFDSEWRARVMEAHDGLAKDGMRVLGVGIRTFDHLPSQAEMDDLENSLTFLGLFGLMDPPRPEVKDAMLVCKTAGIRPVMITGDHPLTARHIAKQLGMTEDERFLTGQELDKLSPEELRTVSGDISVFARVSPEHKLKLVNALQEQSLIVAMTGDGVNDAPALKKANIGVAMGITGTDVSKEAADMVLLDDNFATIVAAVEEGRIIYDNIRRFIKYLLSCNASEIAVMLFGPLLGMPLPLLPLQILWMNLVTDGLPALALGVEPAEKNVMKRPPYSSTESIFGRGMVTFIFVMGVLMSIISLGIGYAAYRMGYAAWQSLIFTTLIFAQLALALEARSEENSLFKIGLFSNLYMVGAVLLTVLLQLGVLYIPFLQTVFNTQPLDAAGLLLAVFAGLLVIMIVEVWKIFMRRRA